MHSCSLLVDLLSQDILDASKFDIKGSFVGAEHHAYFGSSGERELQQVYKPVNDMKDMMMESRPSYPTDKLTFSIANLTRDSSIQFLGLMFYPNHSEYDVSLMLEDSQRSGLYFNSRIMRLFQFYQENVVPEQDKYEGQ